MVPGYDILKLRLVEHDGNDSYSRLANDSIQLRCKCLFSRLKHTLIDRMFWTRSHRATKYPRRKYLCGGKILMKIQLIKSNNSFLFFLFSILHTFSIIQDCDSSTRVSWSLVFVRVKKKSSSAFLQYYCC